MIENKQGITWIMMKPKVQTKCALGGDWYTNELTIWFFPDRCYPDYTQFQAWIMQNLDGEELNIEDVVDAIYLYLMEQYSPKELIVRDKVKGCKTHFDVVVEKGEQL